MTTTTLRTFVLLCVAAAMLTAAAAAQSPVSTDASALQARGVQAYFAGRHAEADDYLSRALATNRNDPRTFYFRALSRLNSGRTDEAQADMQIGAALEAALAGRFAIGPSLQRVQGSERLILEKYRQQARAVAASKIAASRSQITNRQSADTAVLRQQVVVPLDEFLSPANPRALTAAELQQRAAIGARTAIPPVPPQRASSQPAVTDANPFGDDSAARAAAESPTSPATTSDTAAEPVDPAEAEPSDEPAAPVETPAPASEPPAASDEDPFSGFQ